MLKAFSIFDNQTNVFHQPFFVEHHQVALRYFVSLCRDEKSDICKFPAAFNLFELGSFDESSGEFLALEHKINHGFASAYINQEK